MHRIRSGNWRPAAVTIALVLTLLTACIGGLEPAPDEDGPVADEKGASAHELVIWAGGTLPLSANFNPFSPTALHATHGPILEPLFAYNSAADTDPIPMLARSAEFNDDGSEMTLKVRQGVKWNDGQAFSVDDVVFTFTHELAKPSYLESAEAIDEETVLLKFDSPQFTQEAIILQMLILPEHVWKELGEDSTATDDEGAPLFLNADDPVGTGPFVVESVTETAYTMVANENYWHEGKPGLERLKYVAVESEQAAEDLLRQGEIDWAGMFISDAASVTAAAGIEMIDTPQDPTVIYTCANAALGCRGSQTDPEVRRALHLAIDRTSIVERAFGGHAGMSNLAFTLPERDDAWIADGIPGRNPKGAGVKAAKKVLEDAGYELGADGLYEKDGQAVDMTLASVEGWSDYNDAAALIEEQAAKAGISVTASTISWPEFADARDTGTFELMLGGVVGTKTADPYQIYAQWFGGGATVPVGEALEPGMWNVSRYSKADMDAAINAAATTIDEAEKKSAYATIQENIVRDLPYIPILTNSTMTFFNAADYTGWPTEDDLYIFPPPWSPISAGVVLGNLRPVD